MIRVKKMKRPKGWRSAMRTLELWVKEGYLHIPLRWEEAYRRAYPKLPEDVALASLRQRTECRILAIATIEAKQDLTYWGIEDPEVESYCTGCKKVHPIEEFEGNHVTCRTCKEKRRER